MVRMLPLVFLVLGALSPAHAADLADADLLTSGTKGSSLGIDIGAVVGMSVPGADFDLHFNYTHHFSGDASGFNLGADLDIIAGEGDQAYLLPALRAGYDHEVARGIYLSPFAAAGLLIGTQGHFGFDARFGLGVKLILDNLWLVNVQPVGVDILVSTRGLDVRYSMLFGGGLIF